jgi:hypothetical protein
VKTVTSGSATWDARPIDTKTALISMRESLQRARVAAREKRRRDIAAAFAMPSKEES